MPRWVLSSPRSHFLWPQKAGFWLSHGSVTTNLTEHSLSWYFSAEAFPGDKGSVRFAVVLLKHRKEGSVKENVAKKIGENVWTQTLGLP